jgi:glucose-1-phosphatase
MGEAVSGRVVVCFDLGGVLVRICSSWAEACARAGLSERNPERLGSDAWRTLGRAAGDRYATGLLECAAYYSELERAIDGLYSASEFESLHRAWTLEHYPGALELVRSLNALPFVTTACLSNTNHAHWVRLVGEDGRSEYPAVAELQHRLASHLLGCLKPDARIYALAQARFSEIARVRPADIFFFDDLEENVHAARAAGWSAFQVDPMGDPVQQMRGILSDAGVFG